MNASKTNHIEDRALSYGGESSRSRSKTNQSQDFKLDESQAPKRCSTRSVSAPEKLGDVSGYPDTKLTREEIEDMKREDLLEAEREYQEK